MLDIEIEYTALSQAVADLNALGDELSSSTELKYAGQDIITMSQGETCTATNEFYGKLTLYHLELMKLVGITKTIINSIGVAFADEENESLQDVF